MTRHELVHASLIAGLLLPLLFSSGCTPYSLIPVTLKEVKDYVVEQEQGFSYPLRRVMLTSAACLEELQFDLKRVETFRDHGRIEAEWQKTSVTLKFEAVTPNLTKMMCRVTADGKARQFSTEKELFSNTRAALLQNHRQSFAHLARGMVPIHIEPDKDSAIVAYLAPGVEISMSAENESWRRVVLKCQGEGFLQASMLKEK